MGTAQEQELQEVLNHIKAVSSFYKLLKIKAQDLNWKKQVEDQIILFNSEFQRLEKENKVPLPILTNIMNQSTEFLKGNISPRQYIDLAEDLSKKSPHGLQILGKIMMVLGTLSLIAAIAVFLVMPPLTPILLGSGIGLCLSGYGLFKQPHDLSKAMTNLAIARPKLETHESIFEEKFEQNDSYQASAELFSTP
jgi:hypothetical protein